MHFGATAKLRGSGAKGDDEAERQSGRAQAELHWSDVIRTQAAGLDHRQSGLFGHDQIKRGHAGRRAHRLPMTQHLTVQGVDVVGHVVPVVMPQRETPRNDYPGGRNLYHIG